MYNIIYQQNTLSLPLEAGAQVDSGGSLPPFSLAIAMIFLHMVVFQLLHISRKLGAFGF